MRKQLQICVDELSSKAGVFNFFVLEIKCGAKGPDSALLTSFHK